MPTLSLSAVILSGRRERGGEREREREGERAMGGGVETEMCVHLDVPYTPVVHDYHSKDVFLCSLHRYWLTLLIAWAHNVCLLPWTMQEKLEQLAREFPY